jgi:hypothetical protein
MDRGATAEGTWCKVQLSQHYLMAYAKLKAAWLLRPIVGSIAFAAAATAVPRLLLLFTETY